MRLTTIDGRSWRDSKSEFALKAAKAAALTNNTIDVIDDIENAERKK